MIRQSGLGPLILAVGALTCALASFLDPRAAQSAADQDWPAFVLVAGLILVGVVASGSGLFEAAGRRLAAMPVGEVARFALAAGLIGLVSALMNLDTAACFLTPVLVHMARTRGRGEAPILYGCLLLTNAGSLLLPGSNLTNIIVAGHLHLAGAVFASHMAPAWALALVVTAIVVGVAHRKDLSYSGASESESTTGRPVRAAPSLTEPNRTASSRTFPSRPAQSRPVPSRTVPSRTVPSRTVSSRNAETWFGAAVVIAATAAVVVLHNAALPVLAIGLAASVVEISRRRLKLADGHRDSRRADARRSARDRHRARRPGASMGPAGEAHVSSSGVSPPPE